ncbi:MAG: AraC family transcriptional regulator, partial [Chthoniobacteraceae bacterium]|nr:AraC family transcriptional regulator [Chthoniobacteraceae bacterium]
MFKIRYLASEPLFQSPRLNIRGVGIREMMPPSDVRRPKGTEDYLFMIFHDAVRLGESGEIRVEAGTIVLWERKAAHFYGNPLQRWSHSWIHCDGPGVRAAWRAAGILSGQPIRLSNPSRAEEYLFAIHEELSGSMEADGLILRNTVENLIQEAARSRTRAPKPPIPQNLLAARECIDTGYDQRITLEQLARRAGLSLPHFCTEFRRHFGIPPIAYLVQRRMRAAAMLLRETR